MLISSRAKARGQSRERAAMPTEPNQISIFLPVLAVVALTIVGFLRMAVARGKAAKARGDGATYYRAFLGEPEPEYAVAAVRHYGNLFEAPTLFYAGCITGYAIGAVTTT